MQHVPSWEQGAEMGITAAVSLLSAPIEDAVPLKSSHPGDDSRPIYSTGCLFGGYVLSPERLTRERR